MKRYLSMLLLTLSFCQTALAIDPGRAKDLLVINEEKIQLKEAYPSYHDNAEELLDRPKEIRIVLADRPIPQESLRGIAFLPVTDLAREGRVKGLLFQFDPGRRGHVTVTLLGRIPKAGYP